MRDGERFLEGRHAIVTGGSRGIGAETARVLAGAGANVTVMGRDTAALDATADRLRAEHGVRVAGVRADVTDDPQIERAFRSSFEQLGDAYVLVNNAGQAEGAAFLETTRELWDRMLAVNLTSAFLSSRQVLPGMIAAGAGRIVNVASIAGLHGAPRIAAYSASKHGLIGLTRSLAAEFARSGITVNAVCPGYVDTEMTTRNVALIAKRTGRSEEETIATLSRASPFRRLVRVDEVARAVLHFCTPESDGTTGQALVIGA